MFYLDVPMAPPTFRQHFVLPFKNRKRLKQTPMPARSFYPDIEDLKVGDRVRFRQHDAGSSQWLEPRRVATVTDAATTDFDGHRLVFVKLHTGDGFRTRICFQNEVLEVLK